MSNIIFNNEDKQFLLKKINQINDIVYENEDSTILVELVEEITEELICYINKIENKENVKPEGD